MPVSATMGWRELRERLRRFVWEIRRGGAERRLIASLLLAGCLLTWLSIGPGHDLLSKKPLDYIRWVTAAIALVFMTWLLLRYSRLALTPPVELAPEAPSAVKGAEPFGVYDKQLFKKLGRGEDLRVLLSHVLDDQRPVTVVMGPSGVGKTSLIRAGLEAHLTATTPPNRVTYWEAVPTDAKSRLQHALDATSGRPEDGDHIVILDQLEQLDPCNSEHEGIFDRLSGAMAAPPPHRIRYVVSFLEEYASTWLPWQARQHRACTPVIVLRPFAEHQAQETLATLASEIALSLQQPVVNEIVRGAMTPDGVLPVDLGIGLLVLSELARRKGTKEISDRDFRVAGGSAGLLATYVQQQLDSLYLASIDRERLVKGLLTLVDLQKNRRITEGRSSEDIVAVAGIEPSYGRRCLDRLASRTVRLLEPLPEDHMRLPHDRLAAAIRDVAAVAIAAQDSATLLFDTGYQRWAQHRRPSLLLDRSDLRRVEQHLPSVMHQQRGPDEHDFLRRSRQRRTLQTLQRSLSLLAVAAALISWAAFGMSTSRDDRRALAEHGLPSDLYDRVASLDTLCLSQGLSDLRTLRNGRHLARLQVGLSGPSASLAGLDCLAALKSLSLDLKRVQSIGLDPLKGAKSLTTLVLDLKGRRGVSLEPLGQLTALTTLALDVSGLNVSLEPLRECRHLTTLQIQWSHNEALNLQPLIDLTELESLSLYLSGDSGASLEHLPQLKNLKTLWLYLRNSRETSLESLKEMKKLTSLSIYLPSTWSGNLGELGQLRSLADLSLHYNMNAKAELTLLRELKNITALSLDMRKISDARLDPLMDLQSLRVLSLDLSHTQGISLEPLAALDSLTSLSMNVSNSQDLSLEPIRQLPRLETLSLVLSSTEEGLLEQLDGVDASIELYLDLSRSREVNLDLVRNIDGLTTLSLNLGATSGVSLEPLGGLTDLATLSLSMPGNSGVSLEPLRALKSLTGLALQVPQACHVSLEPLRELNDLGSMTLCLSDGSRVDFQWLRELPTLREVSIYGGSVESLNWLPKSVRSLRIWHAAVLGPPELLR